MRMGHVVRVARRRHHLEEKTRPRMKQGEEVPDREPTPRLLPRRVAKVDVEFGGIRHGKARPIHQEGPVAIPTAVLLGPLIYGGTDPPQHLLPDPQREPLARLAKGRRGKWLPGQMRQMTTRPCCRGGLGGC